MLQPAVELLGGRRRRGLSSADQVPACGAIRPSSVNVLSDAMSFSLGYSWAVCCRTRLMANS